MVCFSITQMSPLEAGELFLLFQAQKIDKKQQIINLPNFFDIHVLTSIFVEAQ